MNLDALDDNYLKGLGCGLSAVLWALRDYPRPTLSEPETEGDANEQYTASRSTKMKVERQTPHKFLEKIYRICREK